MLELERNAIRKLVERFRAANPHIFGSTLHRTDQDRSDLDLLTPNALPEKVYAQMPQKHGRYEQKSLYSALVHYLSKEEMLGQQLAYMLGFLDHPNHTNMAVSVGQAKI